MRQVSIGFRLPSGTAVLLSIWQNGDEVHAHAENCETGLVIMPHFGPRKDDIALRRQASRYAEPLQRTVH